MKTSRWIFVVGVALLLAGGAGWGLLNLPLAPRLQVLSATAPSAPTRVESNAPQATPLPLPPVARVVEVAAPATDNLAAQPQQTNGLCGQTGTQTTLLVGEGTTVWWGVGAVRMVNVDFDAQTVRVLAFPPDLWVDTPALAAAQITATHPTTATTLDLVYYAARQLQPGTARQKMIYATNLVAQTLFDNFELLPDHYIGVRQDVFSETVEALGGLPINIPESVSDHRFHYPVGSQTLTGEQALHYTRLFHDGEWSRIARQQLVLRALYTQIRQPATLLKLPDLVREFHRNVATDFSVRQALTLACVLESPDITIEYLEIGPELTTPGPDRILYPRTEEIIQFLQEVFLD